jgi:hypothetical protein
VTAVRSRMQGHSGCITCLWFRQHLLRRSLQVFLAKLRGTSMVAVKQMNQSQLGNEVRRAAFLREMALLKELNDAHLVQFQARGRQADRDRQTDRPCARWHCSRSSTTRTYVQFRARGRRTDRHFLCEMPGANGLAPSGILSLSARLPVRRLSAHLSICLSNEQCTSAASGGVHDLSVVAS